YRALSVIAKENDYIQSDVYRNSNFVISRNNRVLYYDCTNFFFEIEEADDFREYGKSKENRPNPIVQMGLFM
ncbi:transposase, partial [Erysipelotrichaceae bacterium 7770_A6]|nr:transposase [Erysipelotrichaceae bacterium 7770_A6]